MNAQLGRQEEQIFDDAAEKILFKMVTALLTDQPRDPVTRIAKLIVILLGALHVWIH